MTAVGDFLAVEFEDDIAALDTRFFRWAFWRHVADQRSSVVLKLELLRERRSHILDHHTQETPRDMAVLDQALHHVAGQIGRNCEADALVSATAAEDGGVDADEPAISVHQRSPGIAETRASA